jgi:hypothetical protein
MKIDGIEVPFDYICGSEVWPSTNTKDSPWSKYVCRLCGGEIKFEEFGSFSIFERPPNEKAIDRVKWHFDHCQGRQVQEG